MKSRQCPGMPIRAGTPASHGTTAERNEWGRMNALSNRSRRTAAAVFHVPAMPSVERQDSVEHRVQFPQRDEAWLDEHRDVRGRVGFTEGLQGRHAHHAVADPVDAADENPSAVI